MKTKTLLSLLFLSLAIGCSRKDAAEELIIGINQSINHDDFEYLVTDYSEVKQIGGGTDSLVATGNFYIVTFKVSNEAKRVRHEWDNTIAYLVDEASHTYENSKAAQQLLEKTQSFGWQEKYVTEHQTVQSTKFVFDLPKSAHQPFLMVRGSTLMGDFLDGGKFEKTKVKLFE